MSNIKKSFKQKSACGFRLGGNIDSLLNADVDERAFVPGTDPSGTLPGQWGYRPDNTGADASGVLPGQWGYGQTGFVKPQTLPTIRTSRMANSRRGLRSDPYRILDEGILGAQNGFFNFGKKPAPVPEVDPRLKQLEESAALRKSMPGYSAALTPAPAPVQAPAPAAPTLSQGGGIMSLPGRRTDLIDKTSGFKHGGVPHTDERGVIVDPNGAPGEVDETPAKAVANNGRKTNILVTPGERIVNKAQNAAMEELAQAHGMSLDDYLEKATGEPVGPTMKKGLRAAEFGWDTIKTAMGNAVKSPDRRAMDAGTATPEQVAREQAGMRRVVETDSPYDVVTPMAPATP